MRCPTRCRTQHGFIGSPVLANLDGGTDGKLDVIAAGMDRHVYAFNAKGDAVPGFPVLVVDRDKVASINPQTHVPTFNAAAGGTGPLGYQWRLNGFNIGGATGSSINVTAAGSYSVVVSKACGMVTGAVATVTVS